MSCVISYDLGTGGIKASLVEECGTILESVFVPYDTSFTSENWQEQAPEDWWQAVISSTQLLVSKTSVDVSEIKALAISGHSLGVVPIGKKGELLRDKTPIWSDQRAVTQPDEFFSNTDYDSWYMRTGCGFPAPCYSIFKIMWYRDNEPEMYNQIDKVIGTKDYCNYRFTGRLCTDYSYASGTGVYDLQNWAYSDDFIAASGINRDILPEIIGSDDVVGVISEEAAKQTGLKEGTLVICGGVDNSCMSLGAKGTCAGRTYTSLGSSSWVALVEEKPILNIKYKPYVFTHVLKGMYVSATCIFSAGSSLQWVRNTFFNDLVEKEQQGGGDAYVEMIKLAAQSTTGSNELVFNPSLAGGSTIEPSPSISGAFVGLRLRHTRADIVHATMEGIALNLRVALDILQAECPQIKEMLIVGGGAKSPFWMQLFANIYNLPIEKSNIDQSAATLGAAALAFNGAGLWSDYSRIDTLHNEKQIYLPESISDRYTNDLLPKFQNITQLLVKM